ncbi:MAG: hypothetical protein JXQ96_11115 [Cyclobacteriaceae bacterium]
MKKNCIFLSLLIITLFVSACGGGDEPAVDCDALSTQIAEDLVEILTTSIAFDADASTANCTSLKSDLENIIKLSKSYRSCTSGQDLDDLNEGIADFESTLADLSCD